MIRRIATIAIISAFLVVPAQAQRPNAARQTQKQGKGKASRQDPQKAEQADARQLQKLQRALKLTDAQSEQVSGLLATRRQDLAQLKTTGKDQRKQNAQAAQERFQTGLRAVLSPEQAQLFDNKRNGRKARTR